MTSPLIQQLNSRVWLDLRSAKIANSTVFDELRTLLTSISGYMEMALDSLRRLLPADGTEMLRVIERSIGRLRLLIEDLLSEIRPDI